MIEKEKKNFFNSFLKTVETDLKHNRTALVFSKEQLEKIKEKYNVRIVREDEVGIYIRIKKGNV